MDGGGASPRMLPYPWRARHHSISSYTLHGLKPAASGASQAANRRAMAHGPPRGSARRHVIRAACARRVCCCSNFPVPARSRRRHSGRALPAPGSTGRPAGAPSPWPNAPAWRCGPQGAKVRFNPGRHPPRCAAHASSVGPPSPAAAAAKLRPSSYFQHPAMATDPPTVHHAPGLTGRSRSWLRPRGVSQQLE